MSSFSGLNTGLSSLYAQRRGLELTGHNVANSNTEGYSRQRLRLEASSGPLMPAVHSRYPGVGDGVRTADVQRLRDGFLDAQALKERGNDAMLRSDALVLSRVEQILAEPSSSGVQSQLTEFWKGWDDVANHPEDPAARAQLLERARTLATGLNTATDRLSAQWSSSHEQLAVTVQDINGTAAAVAEFNRAIAAATAAGLQPNDLADQRDLLVQRLGTLAGVSLQVGERGTVDVYVGGTALVQGGTAQRLELRGGSAIGDAVEVGWEGSTGPAPVGGSAGGLVQGLQPDGALARYSDGISQVGDQLREQVNATHAGGFTPSGAPGGAFFDRVGGRLVVVPTDGSQVAASSTGADNGGGNASALSDLGDGVSSPDALYRKLIVTLGVEAQTANRRVDIQSNILGQLDAARESESGVNLDEEMTSMLAYQRAYEGAARFVSAVDQMLDTLINRTGIVGR